MERICQLMGTAPGVEILEKLTVTKEGYVHCHIHSSLPLQC
jgi:hypothetical protein